MASKYNTIANLSRETARQVTKNEDEWKRYLHTAAQIYRYPFQEQLLIYAQCPDAKACASIDIWNEKMFCWVNRGAKGIALLDEDAAYPKLKYVFEVSDVHESRIRGRKPYLWKMQEQHKEGIITRLESIYGGVDENQNFEAQLVEIAERVTEDNLEDILDELEKVTDGSFLEGLERDSLRVRMWEALYSSIVFTVLKIKKAIAKDVHVDYNALKCEIEKQEHKERGNKYESDLSTKRGLSDSESDNRRDRGETDQVRSDEKDVSKGREERNLHGDAVGGDTHEASYHYSGAGRREDGTPNEADAEGRGRGRTVESTGSNAVASADERHPEPGRGNDSAGTDLSVER